MNKTEQFLTLYREYETLVRDVGQDPKDLEERMPDAEANRMRMCRLFRNYMSHQNDAGFLEPTEKMMGYLSRKVLDLKLAGDVAKKHLKKKLVVSADMRLADALRQVLPLERELILLVGKDGYRVLRLYDMMRLQLEGTKATKVGVVKPSRTKIQYVAPETAISSLDDTAFYVCTSDGTTDGKLLGVVCV